MLKVLPQLSPLLCSLLNTFLLFFTFLKCLNKTVASITAVTVWKCKQSMDPLGRCLFKERPHINSTRSASSSKISQPVPGFPMLATNSMAAIWNNVPELHAASTLGAARQISQKWATQIPR